MGQVAHALLTRPPLTHRSLGFPVRPFDLHVLGTPPAFILSQDQTLMFCLSCWRFPIPSRGWAFARSSLLFFLGHGPFPWLPFPRVPPASGPWAWATVLFLKLPSLKISRGFRPGNFQGRITVYLSRCWPLLAATLI